MTSLLGPVAVTANLADWTSLTDVTPEHTGQRTGADKALAALAGSKLIIERTKALLKNRKQLDEATARQLDKLLLGAAESPGTIPDVVRARVEAEAHQSSIMDGYSFCAMPTKGAPAPRPTTANEIDDILRKSRDLPERLRVWTASKEIGRPLKPGLVELVKLRNQVAREMGYHSYFALQVADYGMTVDEMMKLLDDALETTKPLYDELHCFARYELAARFKRPPPHLIPAHWIGNRWAQTWPGLIEAANLDPLFKGRLRREHRPQRRELLRLARLPQAPPGLLGALGPLPGAARCRPQEERPRLGLGHRPRRRRPLAHERRAERGVVRHRAPRARPHLLLPLLRPARSALPAARRRQPRLS